MFILYENNFFLLHGSLFPHKDRLIHSSINEVNQIEENCFFFKQADRADRADRTDGRTGRDGQEQNQRRFNTVTEQKLPCIYFIQRLSALKNEK